ncbi:MAG: hypothetical protein WC670_03050 [Pseudolabrys sp.]
MRTEAFIIGLRKDDLNVNDVIAELVLPRRLCDSAIVLAAVLDLDPGYTFGARIRQVRWVAGGNAA